MSEEVKGQIRHAFTALGGALAGMGFIQSSWVEPVVGVLMIVAGAVWSWFAKK